MKGPETHLTRSGTRPLYEQVADDVRRAIADGGLQPEEQLPSEDELADQYGVSRQTVRRALHELTAEGLLASGRGRGRVVRAYQPLQWHLSSFESRQHHEQMGDPRADQWALDVKEQGREPRQDVAVSIIAPPAHVAERLPVERDELVVVRRRVRFVDGTPYQLSDSYFREELVRGTLLMEPRDVSAPGGVLAAIGRPQARYRDEIRIRMPSKAETEQLDVVAGTPVAEHTRTGYAADGTPLRVMITVVPGDRHVLVYELDAS